MTNSDLQNINIIWHEICKYCFNCQLDMFVLLLNCLQLEMIGLPSDCLYLNKDTLLLRVNNSCYITVLENKIFQLFHKFKCLRFELLALLSNISIETRIRNNLISACSLVFIYKIFRSVIKFSFLSLMKMVSLAQNNKRIIILYCKSNTAYRFCCFHEITIIYQTYDKMNKLKNVNTTRWKQSKVTIEKYTVLLVTNA